MTFRNKVLPFLICAASLAVAAWIYNALADTDFDLWPYWWFWELAIDVILLSLAILVLHEGRSVRDWIDCFFTGLGFTLVVQSAFAYLLVMDNLPWGIPVLGCAMATGLVTLIPTGRPIATGSILLLGFDSTARSLAPVLKNRLFGVVDDDAAAVPSGVRYLGTVDRLDSIVAENRLDSIVIADRDRPIHIKPRQLLRLRYAGASIQPGTALYERVFARVDLAALAPLQLLFSPAYMASRTAMSLQAVYTNLAAISGLLLLSPLLLAATLYIRIASGETAFVSQHCVGFQQIPFVLLRFRTRRRDGREFPGCGWLSKLRLVDLPNLINVARGEMTLVGPPPVRSIFARRLAALLPCYTHRFTVRPGILGWSQTLLRGQTLPDERLRLEYDLYYVKHGGFSMDLDVVLQTYLPFLKLPVPPVNPVPHPGAGY